MRVFLTGATGFIGSHIAPELIGAGHEVLGLTRSDAGVRQLESMGAFPYRGTLEDPSSLARGAAEADAVIHTAFDHDFSSPEAFVANIEKDRRVIAAMGDELAGSDRPFIITSGVGMGSRGPGQLATEDHTDWNNPNPRVASERAGADAAEKGASVAVMRLPQVHDTRKQGLITPYVATSRAKGACGYVGDGSNRWAAAHVSDVARLYRLALDHHRPGAVYNAVAEEGVAAREICETVAAGLGVPAVSLHPDEVGAFFGSVGAAFLAMFIGMDIVASSAITRSRLNWHPTGPGLIADLKAMDYAVAEPLAG